MGGRDALGVCSGGPAVAEVLGKEGQELKARVRPELPLLLFITQRGPGKEMLGVRQGTGASGRGPRETSSEDVGWALGHRV